jgi:hypothetical protein
VLRGFDSTPKRNCDSQNQESFKLAIPTTGSNPVTITGHCRHLTMVETLFRPEIAAPVEI